MSRAKLASPARVASVISAVRVRSLMQAVRRARRARWALPGLVACVRRVLQARSLTPVEVHVRAVLLASLDRMAPALCVLTALSRTKI